MFMNLVMLEHNCGIMVPLILTLVTVACSHIVCALHQRVALIYQSATSGMLKNMSLEKAQAPRVLSNAIVTVVLIACIAVARSAPLMLH